MPESAPVRFIETEFAIDGKRIVGPLDLALPRGEVLVLLGRSGSGKTTLLRLVNAMLLPSSGTVEVYGRPTTDWDPVELRRNIGYVIQEIGLLPHLSVWENAILVPRLKGRRAESEARVRDLLSMVGLGESEYRRRLPHELSGGQRQRVGIVRALAADPPLLLCDEPFGALDAEIRRDLQQELATLSRRLEKTVLFVTHDVSEARALGDRIVVLDGGRVAFSGTPAEFDETRVMAATRLRGD